MSTTFLAVHADKDDDTIYLGRRDQVSIGAIVLGGAWYSAPPKATATSSTTFRKEMSQFNMLLTADANLTASEALVRRGYRMTHASEHLAVGPFHHHTEG